MRVYWIAVCIIGVFLASACYPTRPSSTFTVPQPLPETTLTFIPGAGGGGESGGTASVGIPSSLPTSSPEVAVDDVDLVITSGDNGKELVILVGQTIEILPPIEYPEWEISYDDTILSALIPSDQLNHPGSTGWFFRAETSGSTEVVLNTVTPTCPPEEDKCSLMPGLRFEVTVIVKQE